MQFRPATPDDAADILQFWRESGASASVTDDARSIRRVVGAPGAVLLLAFEDGVLVGSLLGTFDGWRGNMYRLAVHPSRRRRGVARQLVRTVESVLRGWGARRITALVEVDRPAASEFWTTVGYPRDDHVVRHVGPPLVARGETHS